MVTDCKAISRSRAVTAGAALVALAALVAGCAPKPTTPEGVADYNERNDPLEPTNRRLFAVNEALDHNVLHPVASGYKDVTPAPVRSHVHNVLSNLGNPAQFTNDVLQGKPRKAGNTFMRLVLNTTVGVGGVFDVATGLGFPDHDTDFGLTLAIWGVPNGPFLFLPVLGPSSPRDGAGYGINTTLDPLTWLSFGGSATLGYAGSASARSMAEHACSTRPTRSISRRWTPMPRTAASISSTVRAPSRTDGPICRPPCRTGTRAVRPHRTRPRRKHCGRMSAL